MVRGLPTPTAFGSSLLAVVAGMEVSGPDRALGICGKSQCLSNKSGMGQEKLEAPLDSGGCVHGPETTALFCLFKSFSFHPRSSMGV